MLDETKVQIRYSKLASKTLNGYDRPTKQNIRRKIEGLTKDPRR